MSRKAGSIPEETKARLLRASVEEFSTHGFQHSSLRRICTKAEVTTGALYFFFRDKEDLFTSAIAPVTDGIYNIMKSHYEIELSGQDLEEEEDIRAGVEFFQFYYQNQELCHIVLNHRDHPAVVSFFDRLTVLMDQQTLLLLNMFPGEVSRDNAFNECTIHWFSHLQIDAVLHIIAHGYEQQRAKEQLKIMIRFLRGGFLSLITEQR
jgi:AcrR family transcriptional regulator